MTRQNSASGEEYSTGVQFDFSDVNNSQLFQSMYPDAETFLRVQSFMIAAESMNVRESFSLAG